MKLILEAQILPSVDGFHSICPHRNWRAKRSCDAISKQHGDVMPSSCHSEKMLWNPSIDGDTPPNFVDALSGFLSAC